MTERIIQFNSQGLTLNQLKEYTVSEKKVLNHSRYFYVGRTIDSLDGQKYFHEYLTYSGKFTSKNRAKEFLVVRYNHTEHNHMGASENAREFIIQKIYLSTINNLKDPREILQEEVCKQIMIDFAITVEEIIDTHEHRK